MAPQAGTGQIKVRNCLFFPSLLSPLRGCRRVCHSVRWCQAGGGYEAGNAEDEQCVGGFQRAIAALEGGGGAAGTVPVAATGPTGSPAPADATVTAAVPVTVAAPTAVLAAISPKAAAAAPADLGDPAAIETAVLSAACHAPVTPQPPFAAALVCPAV